MKQISPNEQNYKVACALSAVQDAVKTLSENNIAVHAISIDHNRPYLMTDDALSCPDISPLSRVRHSDGLVIYRACLYGCVLQFQNYESEEQAA